MFVIGRERKDSARRRTRTRTRTPRRDNVTHGEQSVYLIDQANNAHGKIAHEPIRSQNCGRIGYLNVTQWVVD